MRSHYVDQFATATAATAGWPAGSLAAIYDPTEQGGLAKIGSPDAVLAFVPYAFFVQHGLELHLTPLVQADVSGVGPQERWTLVAKVGASHRTGIAGGLHHSERGGLRPAISCDIRHSRRGRCRRTSRSRRQGKY